MRSSRRIVLLVLAVLLVACSPPDTTGITPRDPALIAEGATLYQANCAECHGTDLRGTERGPSFLSRIYVPAHHGDGSFLVAVLAGVPQHHWDFGPMPPIEGITQDQVAAIVAFVRDTQEREGFDP